MSGHDMRKSALRRYIVFRVKAIEFMDIAVLRSELKSGRFSFQAPLGRPSEVFADALRTVQLSWFALFAEKGNGIHVIKLWKELFPKHAARIDAAWARMEPTWGIIKEFRDRAGFHGDQPGKFFEARRKVAGNLTVDSALAEFAELFKAMLAVEAVELPDLESAVEDLLDDLEEASGGRYDRSKFKRYLLIPDTRGGTSTKT